MRHHRRLLAVPAILVTASVWLLGLAAGPASAQTSAAKAKATVITVTAGKPSELAFTLSKYSQIPTGTVIFKVTNKGVLSHDFKLCTLPMTSTKANTCNGKVTKMIPSGKTATLTVTIKKAGKYEYLCTVPGHASAGMKGLIGVGVKTAAPPKPKTTPTPTPTPQPTTTAAGSSGATCMTPQSTTITVKEFEYGFTLSQGTVNCGTITFVMTNTGTLDHNFDVIGAQNADGAVIGAGQTVSMTATIGPGTYTYQCDVEGHAQLGMIGTLVVTD